MRPLDVTTPRGQASVEQERAAIALFCAHCPELRFIATPKDSAATIDGMLARVEDDTLCALVEVKCRTMTLQDLRVRHRNRWLVTLDKIVRGGELARAHRVPLMGWLYLVPDRMLLTLPLIDADGRWLASGVVLRSCTAATVNGGRALRENAYIDMQAARLYA